MPDDTVVFQALGERMRLRLSDFRDRLHFKDDSRMTEWECLDTALPNLTENERLRRSFDNSNQSGKGVWEQNPVAICVWNRIKTDKPDAADKESYFYTFFVDFVVENKVVFPGGVPRDELPIEPGAPNGIPLDILFDVIAQDSKTDLVQGFTFETDEPNFHRGAETLIQLPRDQWPPRPCQPEGERGEITAGFENRGRVTLPDYWRFDDKGQIARSKHIWEKSVQYYLPAEKRLGNATKPLCVICGSRLGMAPTCAIYLWSSDMSVRMHLHWDASTSDYDKLPTPTEDWIKGDFAVRKIAHSIFIDRPEEDFQ